MARTMNKNIGSWAICFLLFLGLCYGQDSQWEIRSLDLTGINNPALIRTLEKQLLRANDSTEVSLLLDKWAETQLSNGYLEASWASIQYQKGTLSIQLYLGPVYLYRSIQLEGLNPDLLNRAGIEQLSRKHKPINWAELDKRLAYCLDEYQNEGYPFAKFSQLQLAYEKWGRDTVATAVSYQFEAGPLIKIDSIVVEGNHRERSSFVYALTRLSPGDAYNQKLISDFPRILNNSIYYQQVREPEVEFTSFQTAKLRLKLKRKETSKFDVLLGILQPTDNTQRIQFTGTVDIALVSALRQGELIAFKFDKLTTTSQRTQLRLTLPYLFRTPLRLEGAFELQKQEEDFQNVNLYLAGLYAFSPSLSARFYLRNRSTRLLGNALTDTLGSDLLQLDGNRQTLGLGFSFDNLDYRLNPSKGVDANLEIGLGRRVIRENVLIRRNRPDFYTQLDLEQPTQEINLGVKWYHQLIPRHVLHVANHTYWLGMDTYLRNDQLQVGGSRSIRGFDENVLFTDFYSLFTAEYRLQLERDSYLALFGDYAYLEDNASGKILHPFGVGFGMNYGTKAGVLSISYAIGRSEEISFQPARGKVHIGLINQF